MIAGPLDEHLKWLYPDEPCICPHEIQRLGRLYGINMGEGWVRLSTTKGCPHHKEPPFTKED